MPQSELLAEELRLAQAELNAITGEFTADDLLARFSRAFAWENELALRSE